MALEIEQLEFVFPTLVAGQRHKGVNVSNPLWSQFTIVLDGDWVKLTNHKTGYQLWVPREQVAMLVPVPPKVTPTPAPVLAALPEIVLGKVADPEAFTVGDTSFGLAPVQAITVKPRKKPGRKPGSKYARPARTEPSTNN